MDVSLLQNEFQFQAVRSRGPGGQNVNKVSSAAILYWSFAGSPWLTEEKISKIRIKLKNWINSEDQIYIRSDEFRDLERNKSRCIEKLDQLLKIAFHQAKPRRKTKPTRSSKIKKQESKIKHGQTKKLRRRVDY